MRYLIPLAVVIIAQVGAAWAIGDANVARPGGSFSTVEAQSAAACERLCADDTLCMAWSFHANSCELKAIVPTAIAQADVISGISQRAPASMRVRYEPAPTPAAEPVEIEDAPARSQPASLTEAEISAELLGGPETEAGLRLGMGN